MTSDTKLGICFSGASLFNCVMKVTFSSVTELVIYPKRIQLFGAVGGWNWIKMKPRIQDFYVGWLYTEIHRAVLWKERPLLILENNHLGYDEKSSEINQNLCGWENKLSRDFLRSFLERLNIYRCVFRKRQAHLTGEAGAQQWIWGHGDWVWELAKSISKKSTYFFFPPHLLLPLSLPSLFSSPIIVYLIWNLALLWTELYPEVLLRNFRQKDLMRGLGVFGEE